MLRRLSRLHLRRCSSIPRRSMASPPLSSPVASPPPLSSPVAFSGGDGTAVLAPQPESQSGTPRGEAVVPAAPAAGEDAEFGFRRPDFGTNPLVGTVQPYDRHLFLCYKSPEVWPRNVEGSDSDRLPRLLAAEIKASNSSIDKKTRLTVCQGEDGTDFSNGDVLIFPDMIRYRQLTHFDVEPFVDEVLKKNSEWTPKPPEPLSGSYIFVCAHGSRDRRCGVCGPVLIKRFQEEISSRGLQSEVFVSPCSHIGGHKYAGNVIIFSPTVSEAVSGHWYGYVTPEDVPTLLEQHIGKGKIVEHLWRGQMGLSEEDQKATPNLLEVQLNEGLDENRSKEYTNTSVDEYTNTSVDDGNNAATPVAGCCQENPNATCCQVMPKEKPIVTKTEEESTQVIERVSKTEEESTQVIERVSKTEEEITTEEESTQVIERVSKTEEEITTEEESTQVIERASKTEEESTQVIERESDVKLCHAGSSQGPRARKLYKLPTWFESWEREDAYAAAAVVAAIASVAVAYSYYRQQR